MNADIIQDLKQFITATFSQQFAAFGAELRADIEADIKKLDIKLTKRIDDLSKYVADALESSNEANDLLLKNHERRITRLERKSI